jgi:LAO/AO transport system kinase
MEITDLMKAALFDYILIETVGVGQSEVEIVGLADITIVVLVPEAGDEVQTMKAGLMEIADIFVVNKADRPGADIFVKNLRNVMAPSYLPGHDRIPVIKTVASSGEGIKELFEKILLQERTVESPERKCFLQSEKAWYLIQQYRMKDISKEQIKKELQSGRVSNLYQFIQQYLK